MGVSQTILLGLASNRDPPDLCLLSSKDYKHEPLSPGLLTVFEERHGMAGWCHLKAKLILLTDGAVFSERDVGVCCWYQAERLRNEQVGVFPKAFLLYSLGCSHCPAIVCIQIRVNNVLHRHSCPRHSNSSSGLDAVQSHSTCQAGTGSWIQSISSTEKKKQ
jgi:hypothetical protein